MTGVGTVAVFGGGAGGAAAAVELSQRGYTVRLWNRREETIAPYRAGIRYEGVLGAGVLSPAVVTTDPREALFGAETVVVCLPALAHDQVAADLASLRIELPLVLNPGHTGGALHFREVFRAAGAVPPPIAELSTLTYVARVDRPTRPDTVVISGRAGRVHLACLPGGERAVEAALELFPAAVPASDVLATSLSNVNLVLHPPGALLGAAWVEATGGDFRFYADATTPGVARVLNALDAERLAVADAFGHRLPNLLDEMTAIGTVDETAAGTGDLGYAIRSGSANARIKAPDSLQHRYYREDFGYGLLSFTEFAQIGGVKVPLARALLHVGGVLVGGGLIDEGLDAKRLGIEGLDHAGLLAEVRSGQVVVS